MLLTTSANEPNFDMMKKRSRRISPEALRPQGAPPLPASPDPAPNPSASSSSDYDAFVQSDYTDQSPAPPLTTATPSNLASLITSRSADDDRADRLLRHSKRRRRRRSFCPRNSRSASEASTGSSDNDAGGSVRRNNGGSGGAGPERKRPCRSPTGTETQRNKVMKLWMIFTVEMFLIGPSEYTKKIEVESWRFYSDSFRFFPVSQSTDHLQFGCSIGRLFDSLSDCLIN